MLRSLLVGVLALSTASACKGKSDAPAVQPGVAVGKVVELKGDVSATRGAEKRALLTGQEISGDDLIETGAESSVRILFAHNNANWELGPGRKQLVSESLAWKLPKQAPSEAVNEATLAAGRHAERETVTTTNTAPAPTAAPAAQAAPIAPGAAAPMPEPAAAAPAPGAPTGGEGGGGGEGELKQDRRRKADVAPLPADDFTPKGSMGDKEKASPPKAAATKQKESAALDAPPPPPPPPKDDAKSVADENMVAPSVIVKKRMAEEKTILGACMKTVTTATLDVEVIIDKGIIKSFVLPPSATPEMKNCFKNAATRIKFPDNYTLRVKTQLAK